MGSRAFVSDGFALAEAVVACGFVVVVAAGLAPTLILAARAQVLARDQVYTQALASAKLAQLRGLAFTYTIHGSGQATPVSDVETDLSVEPAGRSGRGLSPGTADALLTPTTGYCDFLGASGEWLAGGVHPPPGARYVRRWAVLTLRDDPEHTRVLLVMAATIAADTGVVRSDLRPRPADTWLFTVLTRSVP